MREKGIPVLGTRANKILAERIILKFKDAEYDEFSKTVTIGSLPQEKKEKGLVVIVSAGTSDISVAGEAFKTAQFFGSKAIMISDVGIAGIHRLFNRLEEIRKANAIVAVAGMEGALPGVIAGLVSVPVIAVPTSVGYGASFKGVSALLGMLTSCAPGISVVNIDNGFGAGYQANLINQLIHQRSESRVDAKGGQS